MLLISLFIVTIDILLWFLSYPLAKNKLKGLEPVCISCKDESINLGIVTSVSNRLAIFLFLYLL